MTGARARGGRTCLDWMGSLVGRVLLPQPRKPPPAFPARPALGEAPRHFSSPRLLLLPGARLPSHSEELPGEERGAVCGEGEHWDLTGIRGSPGSLGQKEVGPSRPGVRAGSCQVCTCCAYLLSWPKAWSSEVGGLWKREKEGSPGGSP